MTWFAHLPLITLVIGLRYFIIAGILFFVFYKWLRKRISYRKIQARFPKKADYWREIGYSCITIVIFSVVSVIFINPPLSHITQRYTRIDEHGMVWFVLAFPLMFIVHDAWFYWTHRLMHHPPIFRIFHLVHHRYQSQSLGCLCLSPYRGCDRGEHFPRAAYYDATYFCSLFRVLFSNAGI